MIQVVTARMQKCFIQAQNLVLVNKKFISKFFVQHLSGDKHQNKDWMFEESITTDDQRKSFKL